MTLSARPQTVSLWEQSSTAVAAGGNTADIDVSQLRELALDINVTGVAGTAPTLNITISRKGLDGVYYPIYTSAALNAAGKTSAHIGPGLPTNVSLGGTLQVAWAIGGSASPSVTFSASLVGK